MPPLVFALVGCAAVMHATWNVILKAGGDPLRTSGRLSLASVVVGVPIALVAWISIGTPGVPVEAIGLAIVSGALEFLYFVFLSAAYRRGELSVVYPIARGSAPLLAVAAGVILLGERLGVEGAAGVAALAAGILVLQRPWRAVRASAGRGGAGAFALATGVTIAAYSAVDRVGARLVEPWLYAAMLFSVSTVLLLLWIRFADVRLGRARRRAMADPAARAAAAGAGRVAADGAGRNVADGAGRNVADGAGRDSGDGAPAGAAPWPAATAAGLIATGAYLLVLAAYTLAPLSVVAPLRESAVVLVSGWGSFRLREATNRGDAFRRVGGAGLVLLGALLLALE